MTKAKNRIQQLLIRNKGRGSFSVKAAGDEVTIYLYDAIVDTDEEAYWYGGISAEAFVKEVAAIKASTIHLRVNSPGGSVFGGRAMETALRGHSAKVVAHVDGVAASAASIVIMGADSIEMSPGAFIMIHKAWSIGIGNADDMLHLAGLLEKVDNTLAATYVARTGLEPERIASMMTEETWIEAAEAVELGFADTVQEGRSKAAAAWDLSAYEHAPTQAAQALAAKSKQVEPVDRDAMKREVLSKLIPA